MSEPIGESWRKCSSCKAPIAFASTYFVCSVSTCNTQRTGYVFCSVHCFERHLPGARHKDAAAVEKTADRRPSPGAATSQPAAPARVYATANPGQSAAAKSIASQTPREVLVIASRLKDYIQVRSDCNTSASVFDVLSDHLRVVCDRAIEHARSEGRKTVMDRDFTFLKKSE